MSFKTVFDVSNQGYSTWTFSAFGLIFVFVGVLLVFKAPLMQQLMPTGLQGRARKIFSWFFLVFSVLWVITTFSTTYAEYRRTTEALKDGKFAVVEGPVTDFVPMPYTGHSEESFVVGDHQFSYSDYIVTDGFHNTTSHGGPIHQGLYVRVSYVGNTILKLEVAP